jgi:hypothetical protein
MTNQERVQALAEYGFTERQARFLLLVMRHSGLCVKRQYAAFAGIKPGGEKCNAFFAKLVRRGYAVTADCIHNRAHLYHVHHKPLYHAIGDPESRYRRPVPAGRAKERLMRLDAALISPDLDWLTTRAEKLAYLAAKTAQAAADGPISVSVDERPDLLLGTFPIGFDPGGRAVLLYVATVPWTDDLRSFLVGHLALLAATPRWTVRIVFPPTLQRYVPDYERAVYEELEKRLDPAALNELRWYFFHCKRATDWKTEYQRTDVVKARFDRCAQLFAGPRFTRLYRRWLKEGDPVLTPVPTAVSEAFASGRAVLDLQVLPHTYDHLSPLVSRCRSRRRHDMADAIRGAGKPRALNPLS